MILIKAGEKVGIVAMEIAQRTRLIGVQVLKFRGRIRYGDMDFWDVYFGNISLTMVLRGGNSG